MSEREQREVDELSEQLDQEADDLARHSDELGDRIDDVREDWRRKRADRDVPGAVPLEEDRPDEPPTGAPSDRRTH